MRSGLGRLIAVVALTLVLATVLSCRTAGVQRSYMALDGAGDRQRSVFFTDSSAIWCISELAIGNRDTTINAVIRSTKIYNWAGNPPGLVPETLEVGYAEAAPGPGDPIIQGFQFTPPADPISGNAQPFPAGEFFCDIQINGKVEDSVPFSIQVPECPVGPAITQACLRFYPTDGTKCPTLDPAVSCICNADGAFRCCPTDTGQAVTTTACNPGIQLGTLCPSPTAGILCRCSNADHWDCCPAFPASVKETCDPNTQAGSVCPTTDSGVTCTCGSNGAFTCCPLTAPQNGDQCNTAIELGSVCPSNDPRIKCTCEANSTWKCP